MLSIKRRKYTNSNYGINKRCLSFLIVIILVLTAAALPVVVHAEGNINIQVIYSKKKNSSKKIALTFDDGPHPVYTEMILDILTEYDIHATFFVVGENADLYPEIVRKIVNNGNEIGNHTYTHRNIQDMKAYQIKKEIQMCEDAIYEICEYKTKLFRPPEGILPDIICKYAAKEDYTVILWSIDTRDWAHTPVSKMVNTVESQIGSGEIILMHDYITNSKTPEALKIIIPYLIREGYKFVTVSELIGSK